MPQLSRRSWLGAGCCRAAGLGPGPLCRGSTGQTAGRWSMAGDTCNTTCSPTMPLAGNQLAVFTETAGLTAAQMQAMTRETKFSECTFVQPPELAGTDVRLRIFGPANEMQFAGHPVIGSTFALADDGVIAAGRKEFTFGLGIGPTLVELEWQGDRAAVRVDDATETGLRADLQRTGRPRRGARPRRSALRPGVLPQEVSCGSAVHVRAAGVARGRRSGRGRHPRGDRRLRGRQTHASRPLHLLHRARTGRRDLLQPHDGRQRRPGHRIGKRAARLLPA